MNEIKSGFDAAQSILDCERRILAIDLDADRRKEPLVKALDHARDILLSLASSVPRSGDGKDREFIVTRGRLSAIVTIDDQSGKISIKNPMAFTYIEPDPHPESSDGHSGVAHWKDSLGPRRTSLVFGDHDPTSDINLADVLWVAK